MALDKAVAFRCSAAVVTLSVDRGRDDRRDENIHNPFSISWIRPKDCCVASREKDVGIGCGGLMKGTGPDNNYPCHN